MLTNSSQHEVNATVLILNILPKEDLRLIVMYRSDDSIKCICKPLILKCMRPYILSYSELLYWENLQRVATEYWRNFWSLLYARKYFGWIQFRAVPLNAFIQKRIPKQSVLNLATQFILFFKKQVIVLFHMILKMWVFQIIFFRLRLRPRLLKSRRKKLVIIVPH